MERHSLRTFFALVRFRITVTGNFFNLDSHFAKAGRRLRSVLHGGGGPQVTEVTRLGRVTRLSLLQSLNGHLHLSCKLDQIKMRDYIDRRVTNYT